MILVVALAIALAGPDAVDTSVVAAPDVAAVPSTATPVTTNAIPSPILAAVPPYTTPSLYMAICQYCGP
jgi:hypothetical protein